MNIKITSKDIEILEKQKDFFEEKIRSLEKFSKRYGKMADLEIVVRKITLRRESGHIFKAEAKMQIPGKDLFCKAEGINIEEVAAHLKDNLKRLMIEDKENRQSRWKKIARIIKDKFHFFSR